MSTRMDRMYMFRIIYVLICISCLCTETVTHENVTIAQCGSCTCGASQASVDCSYHNLKSIPMDLPSNLKDLNLSRNEIDISVPTQEKLCQKYPELTQLSLAWNGLRTLSRVLEGCEHLEHLDLTGNVLEFLSPVAFKDLQRLRELSSIEVTELRHGIFQNLKRLETLNLTFYGITIEPGIFIGLTSMRKLTLTLEKVLTLPEHLFSFNDENVLKSLTLTGSKVKNIPDDLFVELVSLKELSLDLPQLLELKLKQDSKPKHLQVLEISNVRSLAEDMLSGMDFLETVKLHGIFSLTGVDLFKTAVTVKELEVVACSLTHIPEGWLHNMIALEILNLSENELEFLKPDDFLHLTSLVHLILSNNKIQNVPRGLLRNLSATLTHLFMNGNQVKELQAETFADLEMLEVLDLRQNVIRSIAPTSLKNLPRLHTLLLSGNYISYLDHITFEYFPMLGELDLADNMISFFPDTLLASKVFHLLLTANSLHSLPGKKLCEMGSLQTLGLEDNPIICDCSVRALHKCLPHLIIHGKCSSPPDVEGQNIGEVTECFPSLALTNQTTESKSGMLVLPDPLVSTPRLTLVSRPDPSLLVSLTLSNLTSSPSFGLQLQTSSGPSSTLAVLDQSEGDLSISDEIVRILGPLEKMENNTKVAVTSSIKQILTTQPAESYMSTPGLQLTSDFRDALKVTDSIERVTQSKSVLYALPYPLVSSPASDLFVSRPGLTPHVSRPAPSLYISTPSLTPLVSSPASDLFVSTPSLTGPAPSLYVSTPSLTPLVSSPAHSLLVSAPSLTPLVSAPSLTPLVSTPSLTPLVSSPAHSLLVSTPGLTPLVSTPSLTPLVSAPSLTPLVSAPSLTPLVSTPGLTPLVSTPGLTPLVSTPGLTPLVSTPGLTPLVSTPSLTPLVSTPGLTPLVSTPSLTPLVSAPSLTPLVSSPAHSLLVSTPGLTPLVSTPSLTPLVSTPSLTPLVSSPAHSLLVSTPGLTPLVSTPGLTPLVSTPSLTPLVSTPSLTPLVSTPSLTPLVSTPSLTPLVSTPSLTPLVSSPAHSLLVSTPGLTPHVSLTLSNMMSSPSFSLVLQTSSSFSSSLEVLDKSDGDLSTSEEIVKSLGPIEIIEHHSELIVTSSTEQFLTTQFADAHLSTSDLQLTLDVGDALKVSENNETSSPSPVMVHITPVPAMFEEEDGEYLNQATDITVAIFTSLVVVTFLLSGIWLYRKYFQSGSYNTVSSSREPSAGNVIQMQPLMVQRDLNPSQQRSNMTVDIVNPSQNQFKAVESANPSQNQFKAVEIANPSQNQFKAVEIANPSQNQFKAIESANPSQNQFKAIESADPSQNQFKTIEILKPRQKQMNMTIEISSPSQNLSKMTIEVVNPSQNLSNTTVEFANPSHNVTIKTEETAKPSQNQSNVTLQIADHDP